jgi:hydroxymethylcytosylglucuronate/cytosylglucuronate synthase
MSVERRFSLLAATRHIGWGGVGKLRLILDKLPSAEVGLYDNQNVAALTKQFLGPHYRINERALQVPDVALVINDPGLANKIADLNVPVVYVDSLPYVHRTDTNIPTLTKLASYCAQKYPMERMPLTNSSLRKEQNIKWIDPIIPEPQSRRGGRGIVINLGGLYTYGINDIIDELANAAVDAYLDLVLFPLVGLLAESGRTIFAICGNLKPAACERLRAILPQCRMIGPQSPHVFERTLVDADLLITIPGSTTILQAMSINLPTLLLPPENRSQFFNARVYSKPGADTMQWPVRVLDQEKVEQVRADGITGVLGYVYKAIIDASSSPDISEEVLTVIRTTISNSPSDGVLNNKYLPELGVAGAIQVAELLKEIALRTPRSIMTEYTKTMKT